MRIQKTVEPTLQPPVARAATDKPAAKATSFDADTFVRSGRNPDGDVGGNGSYGTSAGSTGARSR